MRISLPTRKRCRRRVPMPSGHLEIYIYDLGRGTKSQFSFSQSRDDDPIWSPDGNTIVFDSARNGRIDLYTRPANGAQEEEFFIRTI